MCSGDKMGRKTKFVLSGLAGAAVGIVVAGVYLENKHREYQGRLNAEGCSIDYLSQHAEGTPHALSGRRSWMEPLKRVYHA